MSWEMIARCMLAQPEPSNVESLFMDGPCPMHPDHPLVTEPSSYVPTLTVPCWFAPNLVLWTGYTHKVAFELKDDE